MADVVIVGGGVIGAACALELAERGATVTLVERDHLAAHASGRNQGLWLLPEDDVNLPMAEASLARYLSLAPDAPIDVNLDPRPVGQILVANDRREFQAAKAAVASATAHGVEVEELATPISIRDAEPALTRNLAGAWLVHHGHRMDPGALTLAMSLAAAEHGASIRHHLNTRTLAVKSDTVVGVVTDDGVIEADTTVVAAGPWSHALLDPVGVHLPITGARGWIVRLEPDPDLLEHVIETPYGSIGDDDPTRRPTATEIATDGFAGSAVGTIIHPHRDGRTVLVGSSRQTWLTPEPAEPDIVQRLLASAIAIVPALGRAKVLSSWWGVRPLSPDERPFVGAVREGLMVATGHGSEGVILGAGTGQLIAAQLAGETPPFDPAPFDPLRFDGAGSAAD
jgi:glycine/D-amino acid oxidase-like deaminating enzyme